MTVEMREVSSKNIRAVGYDTEKHVLHIDFKGRVYKYQSVPPDVHAALMAAESKGKHFRTHLWGRYSYS